MLIDARALEPDEVLNVTFFAVGLAFGNGTIDTSPNDFRLMLIKPRGAAVTTNADSLPGIIKNLRRA